jgi:hypothetical protein
MNVLQPQKLFEGDSSLRARPDCPLLDNISSKCNSTSLLILNFLMDKVMPIALHLSKIVSSFVMSSCMVAPQQRGSSTIFFCVLDSLNDEVALPAPVVRGC